MMPPSMYLPPAASIVSLISTATAGATGLQSAERQRLPRLSDDRRNLPRHVNCAFWNEDRQHNVGAGDHLLEVGNVDNPGDFGQFAGSGAALGQAGDYF